MTAPNPNPTLSRADQQILRAAAHIVELEARKYSFEAGLFAMMKPEHQSAKNGDQSVHKGAQRYARLKRMATRLRELADGKVKTRKDKG